MKSLQYQLNLIDSFLNKTPMYKLVVYALLTMTATALIESFFKIQPYSIQSLLGSLALCLGICLSLNYVVAKTLKLPIQFESSIITALILFLVLYPVDSMMMLYSTIIASVLATLSKYILVYRNTHIFNPAAFGIFAVNLLGFGSAFWWIGSIYTLPVVLIAGLLVVRKIRREALFFSGLISSLIGAAILAYFLDYNYLSILYGNIIAGPVIFFLTIMVTEPHTITKNRFQQILYAAFIMLLPASLTAAQIYNVPPELSLLVANAISLYVSNRKRFVLKLKSITKLSEDIYEYNFEDKDKPLRRFNFRAGEYLEWNLYHTHSDDRGIRRYFTISSAPHTSELSLATKYAPANESTFKIALKSMRIGDIIYASQLGGDFILPAKALILSNKNIVMMAGGIGITPFISQLRDLMNKKEKRSIVLFYCVRFAKDIVFIDELKKAIDELGIKVVCVISEPNQVHSQTHNNLFYEQGYMTKEILQKYTQNLHNTYYISGPNIMVEMIKKILFANKIHRKDIHTDYFLGF